MTLPPNRLKAVYEYRFHMSDGQLYSHVVGGFGPLGRVKEQHMRWNVTAEPSVMDLIIDWKLRSPRNKRMRASASEQTQDQEDKLIRQFTIELRVNYADADKNEVMRKACAAAARHVFATANLLADGVKPDIAIFSDDWFAGKEEISLMQDVIQQGLDETNNGAPNAEATVSSELMAAVRDSQ
jgi:hypothetical protein